MSVINMPGRRIRAGSEELKKRIEALRIQVEALHAEVVAQMQGDFDEGKGDDLVAIDPFAWEVLAEQHLKMGFLFLYRVVEPPMPG